ncbi:C4BPA protein, partial [Rhinopomastus cyanomelas]|nr:C4BPA protein [Rhinopomastus cyanomelas]
IMLPQPPGDCLVPRRFTFAESPPSAEPPFPVGTKLRYSCRPGYTMAPGKSPQVTCQPNSTWTADLDFCIGQSCSPPDLMNGYFNSTTDLRFGATITYRCNPGFRLVGKPSAQCVLAGSGVAWDHTPFCTIILCPPPPEIANGWSSNTGREFPFGVAVTYSCNEGFSLVGESMIHCTANDDREGLWSGEAPECRVVKCRNPSVENGRRLSGFGTDHGYKDTVAFGCNTGYSLQGSSVVTCGADSEWEPSLPTCEPIYCGPAPQFPFAELMGAAGNTSPFGTKLRYRCRPGYTAAGGKSSVVTCQEDADWAADQDFCVRQQCPTLVIKNGKVTPDNFLFESVVTFTCHPKYELKGPASSKCVVSGNGVQWEPAPPRCERRLSDVVCGDPPTIDKGMHNGTGGSAFAYGSVVVYQCEKGFTLAGSASLQCLAGDDFQGVWSRPAPQCRGGANMIVVGIFPLLLALLVMDI